MTRSTRSARILRIIGLTTTATLSMAFALIGTFEAMRGNSLWPWFIASMAVYGLEFIYAGVAAYKHWHHPEQVRRRARVRSRNTATSGHTRTQKKRAYHTEESPEQARTFN